MDSVEWCRARVAPKGSDLAMILVFCEERARDRVVGFQALREELTQIAEQVSDPDVARAKIAWWRHALDQFAGGHAEHPVLKALIPWHTLFDQQRETVEAWLAGLFNSVEPPTLTQWDEVKAHLCDQLVPVLRLETSLFDTQLSAEVLDGLAIGEGMSRVLRDIRRGSQRAPALLPYAELAEYQVTRGELSAVPPGPGVSALYERQRRRTLSAANQATQAASARERDALRHIYLRLGLDRQLLGLLRRRGPAALSVAPGVSGQRKLWRLWRDARRLRRGALNAR